MIQLPSHYKSYEEYLILKKFSVQTRKLYLKTLRKFIEFCNHQGYAEPLVQENARAYIMDRLETGMSWATINCDYSVLRNYYKIKH